MLQMGVTPKYVCAYSKNIVRWYSAPCRNTFSCKLLIVGGGTGGCSVAWRFAKRLKDKRIIILEPSKVHYYQPSFSQVATGLQKISQSHKPLCSVLPRDVTWVCDHAEGFDPSSNVVYTRNGDTISYEYMVVAVGLKNDYDKILGLKQALEDPHSTVSTIYSPDYCTKTWCNIRQFKGGHAIFTSPMTSGKCSGAAQKIMYMSDDYWRRRKIRGLTSITYNTGGNVLFGVPKYATALTRIACTRGIVINYGADLIEVTPRGAVFTASEGGTVTCPYNLLHVTPPMSPPTCLSNCSDLVNEDGYLDVDQDTLQHKAFPNVYGLGDCTSTPNSKTAAAVAVQSSVLEYNLSKTMTGKPPVIKYNGYSACPIMTSYKTGILAEFLYDKKIWETFPFDQSKERRILSRLNNDIFHRLYWNCLIKGKWNGPRTLRRVINPFGR